MHRRTWLTIAGAALSPALLYLVLQPVSGCYKGCPEEKHEFCARNGGKDCGEVTAPNLCGEVQTINCGKCYGPDICGGAGVPGVCSPCKQPAPTEDCSGGWCKIPSGCFTMGAHVNDPCDDDVYKNPPPFTVFGQEPLHQVALTQSFELMEAEVTQEEFKALMGYNPSKNTSVPDSPPPKMPVEYVSWHEAAAYANALSAKQGYAACYSCSGSGRFVTCDTAEDYAGAKIYDCLGYRLPTEAEWEYAYRAGNVWPLYNLSGLLESCSSDLRLSKIAWSGADAPGTSYHHTVKTKAPNTWGLYDMAGNVFEWCHDWGVKEPGSNRATNPLGAASGTYKNLRSCAYDWPAPKFFRASTRRLEDPKHVCASVGMRLARTLKTEKP